LNEILYEYGYNLVGTFVYSLELDGLVLDSHQTIFANCWCLGSQLMKTHDFKIDSHKKMTIS